MDRICCLLLDGKVTSVKLNMQMLFASGDNGQILTLVEKQ